MDNRRGPRYVIDPKVRQVGFVTPGSEPANPIPTVNPNSTAAPIAAAGNPPSPVIIPPRIPEAPSIASPVPVPSPPSMHNQPSVDAPLPGSYNPNDSVLGTSPVSSANSRQDSNGRYNDAHSESLGMSSSLVSKVSSGMEGLNIQDAYADKAVAGNNQVPSTGDHPGLKQQAGASPDSKGAPLEQQALADGGAQAFTKPLKERTTKAERRAPLEQQASADGGAQAFIKPLKERTTKAERRAKQEADREAKRAVKESAGETPVEREAGTSGGVQKDGKSSKAQKPKETTSGKNSSGSSENKGIDRVPAEKEKKKEIPAPRMQFDDEHRVAKARKRALIEQTEMKNRVELFRHLPQFMHGTQLPSLEAKYFSEDPTHPHPAVYQIGLQYLTGDIVGANARCVAMLWAFREIIVGYSTPREKSLIRDLMAKINSNVSFLTMCRPLSISMGNAIRFLKMRIAKLPMSLSEAESKSKLVSEIERFIQEKIYFADKEITKQAVTKIRDGDVVLTYAASCVVEMILLHAYELGRKFRVVVVDSRPKLEGKGLLKRLLGIGISCTYTHINAVSYIMQEVTRVFLGASSILSNGTVYSRVGTAGVAMVAHAFHVPVLVCCETYKFHERVQLDSICANELGDPDALSKVPGRNDLKELDGWDQSKHLQLLNLLYDATPAEYVSMIVTEIGMRKMWVFVGSSNKCACNIERVQKGAYTLSLASEFSIHYLYGRIIPT